MKHEKYYTEHLRDVEPARKSSDVSRPIPSPGLEDQPQTRVTEQLFFLSNALDSLRERLLILQNRLESTLAPDHGIARALEGDATEYPSPLVLNLMVKHQTVVLIEGMVMDILDRLEL